MAGRVRLSIGSVVQFQQARGLSAARTAGGWTGAEAIPARAAAS